MKIARVSFINVVQCGGSVTTASAVTVTGNRPGQTPFEIDLVEIGGIPSIKLQKFAGGKHLQTHVPIFNVSHFEPFSAEQLAAFKKVEDDKAAAAKKVEGHAAVKK